jgi:diaminohydroxyphosphoribosylaminopyrimidine deaminase/5-amino-6-(5-phosphoribosylamino)uracil reductase
MMSGRSLERFRALGVEVVTGVLEPECQKLIRGFSTAIKKGRPYITLKAATSLDGKIATVTGESKWITSVESRAAAHQERAEHDAILVGVGTVLADDPKLNVRLPGQHERGLTKVILDTDLRTPLTSQIFQTAGRVIIYCGAEFNAERRKALEAAGATVFPVNLAEHRKVLDIKTVVQHLAHRGVQELLVEGGAQVLGSFVREGLFDRLVQFMAPVILGADARSAFEGFTPHGLNEGIHLSKTSFTTAGPDLVFEGHV